MFKFLKKPFQILIIVISVVLFVEFSLRGLGYTSSSPHIMYDETCFWRMAPNQKIFFRNEREEKVEVTINSKSARGEEFLLEKPKNEKRIICLGDSFTYGFGVDDSQTYPVYLEQIANENGNNIQVINFGCNGYTILHETKFLKNYGLQYKPDYVLIGATIHTDFSDIEELDFNIGYMPVPRYNFIKTVIRKTAIGNILLKQWNAEKIKALVEHRKKDEKNSKSKKEYPFSIYTRELDKLVKVANENIFELVYIIMPHEMKNLDEIKIGPSYRKEGMMTAREYYDYLEARYKGKLTVIELISSVDSPDMFLLDWHLNEKGNKKAAEVIYERLEF